MKRKLTIEEVRKEIIDRYNSEAEEVREENKEQSIINIRKAREYADKMWASSREV